MKTRWNYSLVTKLTVAFISVFSGLWVLIQINAYENTYNATMKQTLSSYEQISEIRSQMNNSLFAQAMDDTLQFHERLIQFGTISIEPDAELIAYQFNLDNNQAGKNVKQLWALQTFGIAGQQRYIDSFIVEPGKRVSIYAPSKVERSRLKERVQEIEKLSKQPSETGFRWSEAKYDQDRDSLYIIVSFTPRPQDKHAKQIGFAIDLKDIMTVSDVYQSDDHNLFLAPSGFVKKQSNIISEKTLLLLHQQLERSARFKELPELIHTKDFYIISKYINGPGWLQVTMIPKSRIEQYASAPFHNELKWSLFSFVLMILLMLRILWVSLAKTIRSFVEIIKSDIQPTFSRRLPESRRDELGDIARAYNMLLDTIKSSYDELESKVEQRTTELAKAKQIAERATARKSEHLTNISHELRTPLNGITGSLELLRNTQLTSKQADLRDAAYTCAKSLLGIINNLLDFSRIEADQVDLNLADNLLLKVVDESMLTIQSNIVKKPIELKAIISEGVPESCVFDPIRVRQILVNLLGNAAKFTEKGHIFLYLECDEQSLIFSVEDSGMGIPSDKIDEVFEPFKQSSRHQVGTGLGLPISRKLARIMGGSLTVKTQQNIGSTFVFKMPLRSPGMRLHLKPLIIEAPQNLRTQITLWGGRFVECSSSNLNSPDLDYLPWRLWQKLYEIQTGTSIEREVIPIREMFPWKLKVLLVDDVETNRDILSKMLIELGQEVVCVASGEDALTAGKTHIFDLVLMDIRMPVLDGYETTLLWRGSEDILDTECPIMALTANANHSEHDQSIHLMDGYLTKPISLKEMTSALDKAAELQIDRDMQPEINTQADTPIMDFAEDEFSQRLESHFKNMALAAREVFADKDWQELKDILHNVKGSASLAGVKEVSSIAAQLEKQIRDNGEVCESELNLLLKALESPLNP